MDTMISEILCLVCSFLAIEDVRRFRLCCRAFADAGARFAFREVVFYLHKDDLDMLRHISLHPIASKNVRSLVYVGHIMAMPKKSLDEFRNHCATIQEDAEYFAEEDNVPPPPKIRRLQLKRLYEKYEITMDQQKKILEDNEDITCIREVISRFSSLREITMSCRSQFWPDQSKTPFQGCLLNPNDELRPSGCRQLNSLLSAVFEADIKLRGLTAGIFSWRFFQNPLTEFKSSIHYYDNLTCLELCIDTGITENSTNESHEVPECQQIIETGLLRDFIKSLSQLRTLHIAFTMDLREFGYYARLEDVMEPKHKWAHLHSLSLDRIICERQDVKSMLRKHKDTLKELCLSDIYLRSSSWRVLLPKIRKAMNLDRADISGWLYGKDKDTLVEECWDLQGPVKGYSLSDDTLSDDVLSDYTLGDKVNDYLVNDRIKRCPLTNRNTTIPFSMPMYGRF
ncbi:hypothetical protein F5Y04DRAFT_218954 [Hypomontagnella monticulosa]|nr:hypothetical protein F5Y04DRAFT_218954 [Hypomontagnella monticulosa]